MIHQDVEFAVEDAGGNQRIFKTFDEAAGFAVIISMSQGKNVNIDVLCYSEAGAVAFGCLESYRTDPEASVTERVVINANNVGHVP